MESIQLVDITAANWIAICYLDPGKDGREFVASNSFSIVQSVFEHDWVIKGIQVDNILIGFTMYGFSDELKAYELCRFMIDQHYQGKGYGKCALKSIVDEMFRSYHCDKIYLSTSPNNFRGKHIYENCGFTPTGDTCGEDDNFEEIYCLSRNI